MELLLNSIKMDWPVLLPILFCSVLVVAVAINRFTFYSNNKVDIETFMEGIGCELDRNNVQGAITLCKQLGRTNIIGKLTEKAINIYNKQKSGFSRAYDIEASLSSRKLEKNLTILGTIGGVAPFLGLFGTVVRILYTFQDLAVKGNQSAAVAMGIGSALIATAFGLGVAIIAVILYNSFQAVVKHYEDDFQLIKSLFLGFVDKEEEQVTVNPNSKVVK